MVKKPDIHIPEDKKLLLELDQAARIYGWEIGAGRHPMTDQLTNVSDDNPFVDRNWRDNVIKLNKED